MTKRSGKIRFGIRTLLIVLAVVSVLIALAVQTRFLNPDASFCDDNVGFEVLVGQEVRFLNVRYYLMDDHKTPSLIIVYDLVSDGDSERERLMGWPWHWQWYWRDIPIEPNFQRRVPVVFGKSLGGKRASVTIDSARDFYRQMTDGDSQDDAADCYINFTQGFQTTQPRNRRRPFICSH